MASPLPVTRAHRLLDLLAAGLVIAGGALYGVAYVGLDRIRRSPEISYERGMVIDQLARYHRLNLLSWVALAAIAAGIGVAVYAWREHRRAGRAADSTRV